ncbi:uncharacterized protein LOC130589651 [Beta vulgaris subsp. vulgaris]|uniref:uncharacterized protein LOC130589651 n=1 Tax=Beta vulgaris subsp. vulgaris TaxID=3555 RepID=UPI0025497DF5|nr:uncharacterized protein LOC130589651 [Beta vulgaris subsp. vulgaris]
MVKRIRDDDSSPKLKKVKSVASSGKILALSTAGKKKEKDGDYDPRCDKSLSKKKGKSDLSPIKFSFSRSNPDEQKDTFDRLYVFFIILLLYYMIVFFFKVIFVHFC